MQRHASEMELSRLTGLPTSVVAMALSGSPAVSLEVRRRIMLLAREHREETPASETAPTGTDPTTDAHTGTRAGAGRPELRGPFATLSVGVIIPVMLNPFVEQFMHALQTQCGASGYVPLVTASYSDPEREAALIRHFREIGVVGIIMISPTQDAETLRRLASEIPLTVMSAERVGGQADTVQLDEDLAAEMILDHLWDRGWRLVEFLYRATADGPVDERDRAKLQALRGQVAQRGMTLRTIPVYNDVDRVIGEHALRWAAESCAVICSTGMLGVEVNAAIRAFDFIPGRHMALLAYDDSFIAGDSTNDVTTIEVDIETYAARVLEAIRSRAFGGMDQEGAVILAKPELSPRATT